MTYFVHVGQFLTRGITNQEMPVSYIVASLQPEYVQEVRDMLIEPPMTNPDDELKVELIPLHLNKNTCMNTWSPRNWVIGSCHSYSIG